MLKSGWEQAYFLFGCFAVKFDWLSRPNGFEFETAVWQICSAWSEDHICQVSWRLDIICGLWKGWVATWRPSRKTVIPTAGGMSIMRVRVNVHQMGKGPHLEVRAQYSLADRTNVTNT
jgi:hypothetical protein